MSMETLLNVFTRRQQYYNDGSEFVPYTGALLDVDLGSHSLTLGEHLLATGTLNSGWTEPDLGAGVRLLWYPRKAAFRAGYVDSNRWNDIYIGQYSFSGGHNTRSSGYASGSLGDYTVSIGDYAWSFNQQTVANSYNVTVFGRYNEDTGTSDEWIDTDSLFIIANGADSGNLNNTFDLKKNGNLYLDGNVAIETLSQYGVIYSSDSVGTLATSPEFVYVPGSGIFIDVNLDAGSHNLYVGTIYSTNNITTNGYITNGYFTNLQVQSLTASQLTATDGSKNLVSLSTSTYPSLTELSYVKGVTSSIQSQITTYSDHGNLSGLSDDDHTQYAKLSGRSGGQVLYGGTASGNTLTFGSTSNATKGTVYIGSNFIYDEVNSYLGLSVTPTAILDTNGHVELRQRVTIGRAVTGTGWQTAMDYFLFGGYRPVLAANYTTGKIGYIAGGGTQGLALITQGRSVDFDYRDTAGTGAFTSNSGVASHTNNCFRLYATWNNAAAEYSIWKYYLTDTNSASTSNFIDYQINSTTKYQIKKDGLVRMYEPVEIYNGTAPTASVTNGIILYAEDVSSSSELKVRDEAGNITTLSPHNFSLLPEQRPSEFMGWTHFGEKVIKEEIIKIDNKRIKEITSMQVNVDILAVIREVEKLSNKQFVYLKEVIRQYSYSSL